MNRLECRDVYTSAGSKPWIDQNASPFIFQITSEGLYFIYIVYGFFKATHGKLESDVFLPLYNNIQVKNNHIVLD